MAKNIIRLTESEVKRLVRESVKTVISEIVDPTIKIQQLIQQANDAYHKAVELQGGGEWPLMDKEGYPYGLSSDIKLTRNGYIIIPFNGGAYGAHEPEKIRILTRAGGRTRVLQGDFMTSGWKDARKILNQIIRDAQIGNGHFENYDPNWENADTPEEYKSNKAALRNMNKQIGRKASADMDYLGKRY